MHTTPDRSPASPVSSATPSVADIASLFRSHDERDRPRYERFWSYYRNELPVRPALRSTCATSPRAAHRPAQAMGLPERFTRPLDTTGEPREIVI
ncbi:MAG: hypothetical protein ACIAQF_07865, partial [Phycisphaerales bacterium JB065]